MARTVRVLVLDGETTQALACVRSLGNAGYEPLVASHLGRPLAAWSRYCRGSTRIPAPGAAGFAALREWARAREVRVVLPCTERSCLLLNHEADRWDAEGITLGCGPAAMLRGAFDKSETLRHAVQCDVAIPPTRLPTTSAEVEETATALRAPWVVKPRFSNSWNRAAFLPDLGVAYVDRREELAPVVMGRRLGDAWPIVQEYVRGVGKGVFALCDHGDVILWFAHERLRDVRPSGSGSSLRRSVPLDPRLRDAAARLLRHLGWHGPAMLEFRDDGERTPWLIEMNGRFWGSLQLAVTCGADFPRHWVALLLGQRPEPPTDYREGVVMRWLWGDVKRLGHLWRGAPRGFPDPYPRLPRGILDLVGPQPRGTRHETWDGRDPWPAVAEWCQGVACDVVPLLRGRRALAPRPARMA